jgi:hypothetical protein
MRVHFVALLVALAVPVSAAAQSGTATATGTTTTQTTTQIRPQTTTADYGDDKDSHWMASGFVGSDFARQVDGSSVNFGGSIGYLYKGAFGAEFLAGFAPDFELNNLVLGTERPQVNSYMFNLIGAAPLGGDARIAPFFSAGLGAITLGSNQLNDDDPQENTLDPDDSRLGGNVGGGIMAYMGKVGIRGDVRYFRAFTGDPIEPTGNPQQDALNSLLPGLDFWRANVGLSFRW